MDPIEEARETLHKANDRVDDLFETLRRLEFKCDDAANFADQAYLNYQTALLNAGEISQEEYDEIA